jgi:hypothetical protein
LNAKDSRSLFSPGKAYHAAIPNFFFTMMAPRSILALLSIVAAVSAFSVQPTAVRPSTVLKESFGFDFAEDSYENTPIEILGEANYKAWVGKIDENSFLNRQVRITRT